eukprot:11271124-Alexandrium_andersonii.AAC.1
MTGLPRRCAATTVVGPDKSATASSATAKKTANACVEQVLLYAIACAPPRHLHHAPEALVEGVLGGSSPPPERSAMNLQTLQNA